MAAGLALLALGALCIPLANAPTIAGGALATFIGARLALVCSASLFLLAALCFLRAARRKSAKT